MVRDVMAYIGKLNSGPVVVNGTRFRRPRLLCVGAATLRLCPSVDQAVVRLDVQECRSYIRIKKQRRTRKVRVYEDVDFNGIAGIACAVRSEDTQPTPE